MIHKILRQTDTRTPWQYLDDLVQSDRGPEHNEQWMTARLQSRWPGPYRVEKVIDWQWQSIEYKIIFDSSQEEMLHRIKWA